MSALERNEIKRTLSGRIDYAHYEALSREIRSREFTLRSAKIRNLLVVCIKAGLSPLARRCARGFSNRRQLQIMLIRHGDGGNHQSESPGVTVMR